MWVNDCKIRIYNFSNFLFYDRAVKSFMLSVCVGEGADFYAWAI